MTANFNARRRAAVIALLIVATAGAVFMVGVCRAYLSRARESEKARDAARIFWNYIVMWGTEHGDRPWPMTRDGARKLGSGSRDFTEWLAEEEHKGLPSNAPPYEPSSTSYLNWLTSQNTLDWNGNGLEQDWVRNTLLFNVRPRTNAAFNEESNPWCVVAAPDDATRASDTPVLFTRNIALTTQQLRKRQPERVHVDQAGSSGTAIVLTRGGTIRAFSKGTSVSIDDFPLPTNLATSVEVWGPKGIRR